MNKPRRSLRNVGVFLSASIPSPDRWEGSFDALEITDAVVAVTREILGAGGRVITAAHPTIAPLLWFIASELAPPREPAIVIYQSSLFEGVLPDSTRRFESHQSLANVIKVPPAAGEIIPDPRYAPRSLGLMRRRMLIDEAPSAAVFVGGMNGVIDESTMFRNLYPFAPTFAFGPPGGEAARLTSDCPESIQQLLLSNDVYPTVAREIVDFISDTVVMNDVSP